MLAVAQQHSIPEAVIKYLEIALGGLPDFDPFDHFNKDSEVLAWRAANARLLNFALLWVWFNTKPGISSEQFEEFRKSLSRYGLLTLEIVEQCWAGWNRGVLLAPSLESLAEQAEEAINPDDLSDEELQERIRKTRAALRKQRGY